MEAQMKTLWKLAQVFVAWVFVVSSIASDADSTANVSILGSVIGSSGKHAVYVILWDSTGFTKNPVCQLRLRPGAEKTFSFSVARGRWAVSAFEDLNDNGILDMGLFGPKEPSGFWRPFHAKCKPRFGDVAIQMDHDVSDADVKLR
jgi:uncharacterized protein (DUF2141 family)